MSTLALSPILNGYQSFLQSGLPNNGGFIYSYAAGSTTPQTTWTVSDGSVANTNPIVLDAGGRPPSEIWLLPTQAYKFVVTDSALNQIAVYDNITGAAFLSGGFLSGAINEAPPVTIASNATVAIGAAASNNIIISGANTISAFDVIAAGAIRQVTYSGAVTITYNVTSMQLVGQASRTYNTGDCSVFQSLGGGNWKEINYEPVTGYSKPTFQLTGIVGTYKNLKIADIGINNYSSVITADEVVLENSSNLYMTARAVNVTILANGTVGAPFSIMSARVASTWYYRWLWYNLANGLTATLDVSSTAPAPPTGYTVDDYKCLLPGASRTDATGNTYLVQIKTVNNKSWYVVLTGSNTTGFVAIASGGNVGSITIPTYVAVAWGTAAPPNAVNLLLNPVMLQSGGLGQLIIAPNNNYGNATSGTSTPPIMLYDYYSTGVIQNMTIESVNIYWASVSVTTAIIYVMGWE